MKRNAKQSSRSSGSGGRLRLTLLLATAAALLLVPAAVASAAVDTHIKIEGTGSGTVKGSGGGSLPGIPPINCSYVSPGPQTGVCDTEHGEFGGFPGIQVKREAAPGSVFAGWTPEEGQNFGTCEPPLFETCGLFTFGEEIKIKAVFNKAFPLTVTKEGGEGTVVSNPAGITCGGTCSGEFEEGKTVTLTASPATGYAFSGWSGCDKVGTAGLTCAVTMSKAKTVKAKFVATPSLKITKAGTGAGKVTATGIGCDENCSEAKSAVKTGTSVTVKVTPAKGSEAAIFESGTGSASGCSGATCSFTISEDSSVKVKFNPIPAKTLTVNLTGPGAYKGKVTGKGTVKGLLGSAVNCGSGCTTQTESFFETDTVTLTAVAATGYTFAGWKGVVCESFGTSPCPVATSENKSVFAEFK